MIRYRALQLGPSVYKPQVWRLWWPFWRPVGYTIFDVDGPCQTMVPLTCATLVEAECMCYEHQNGPSVETFPKVHPLTILHV